jgi:hypothetical protein
VPQSPSPQKKEKENDIRPTFLGQTDFLAFSLDLRKKEKKVLRLSQVPLLTACGGGSRDARNLIKLTNLRGFGDPVLHYSALARMVLTLILPL